MASYQDLPEAVQDRALRARVEIALASSIYTIAKGLDNVAPFSQAAGPPTAHALRVAWAQSVNLANLEQEAKRFLPLLVAANKGLLVSQIKGASDTAVQAAVDEMVDLVSGVSE